MKLIQVLSSFGERKLAVTGGRYAVVLSGVLLLATCVRANQEQNGKTSKLPVLSGSVSDAFSKKPVKGVTISIMSSSAASGDCVGKSFTTDASGQFAIPCLLEGEVTLVLEKKGYKTFRKEKIKLKEGMPVRLNLDILSLKAGSGESNLFHPLLRIMES